MTQATTTTTTEWLTAKQAAEVLGVSPATVRRLAQAGKLKARRFPERAPGLRLEVMIGGNQ